MDDQNLTTPVALSAAVAFAAGEEKSAARQFSGTAYSGGIITDHPFFDAVVFDLATTQFKTPAPALYAHGRPIGVIENATLSCDITIKGKLFSDIDDDAKRVCEMSERGMPWQLSVGIWPGFIENVNAGVTATVNGREFTGPLAIFRNNRIRETSFVTLGADDRTSAAFFSVSEGGKRPQKFISSEGEVKMPQIEQAEHDSVVAAKDAQITELEKQVGELNAKFAAQQKESRAKAVKELFSALGREYKDEDAAHYLGMSDEAFASVAKDMLAVKAKPVDDPELFSAQATKGAPTDESPESLAQRIREYVAEQAAKGFTVSYAAAANHLKTQE